MSEHNGLVHVNPEDAVNSAMEALTQETAVSPLDDVFVGTPYVGFRSPATGKNTPELLQQLEDAKVQQFSFYLRDNLGIRVLPRFEYHLIKYDRIWTKQNQSGQVIAAVGQSEDVPANDDKFREHFYAVILVVAGDSLVPSVIQLRGGISGAIKRGVEALQEAQDPQKWGSRGEQYKLSSNVPMVAGRFLVTGWGGEDHTQDGQAYNRGRSSVRPAKLEDIQRFTAATKNQEFMVALGQALAFHGRRVLEVKDKKPQVK